MRRVRGFSLLEVLIVSAILAIVMGAVYASLHAGSKEYEVNNKRAWAVQQGRVALDEMCQELRQAARLTVQPLVSAPNAPAESTPGYKISFYKALPAVNGVQQQTSQYISYLWVPSGDTQVTHPFTGAVYDLPGSTWVDANGNNKVDEGMLVRIDPNADSQGRTYHPRIMCNYVKNNPVDPSDATKRLAEGFKITQSLVSVQGERMLQLHITLTLQFTDSVNKVLEQTLEQRIFVRNLQ